MNVKEQYHVYLERGVVEEALSLAESYGGKLSPIINNLLKDWIEEEKRRKEIL